MVDPIGSSATPRVMQMGFGEIHTTSSKVFDITMGDFATEVPGNQRIGIRAFQNIKKI